MLCREYSINKIIMWIKKVDNLNSIYQNIVLEPKWIVLINQVDRAGSKDQLIIRMSRRMKD